MRVHTLPVIAVSVALLASPLAAQDRSGRGEPADVFGIYLLAERVDPRITGYGQGDWSRLRLAPTPLIAGDDIINYEVSTHAMRLRRDALARIPRPSVDGIPFVVVAQGQRIYLGIFVSLVSSRSFAVPAIVTDAQMVSPAQPADTVIIERAYPSNSFGAGPDPRGDARIKAALTALNKAKGPSAIFPVRTASSAQR